MMAIRDRKRAITTRKSSILLTEITKKRTTTDRLLTKRAIRTLTTTVLLTKRKIMVRVMAIIRSVKGKTCIKRRNIMAILTGISLIIMVIAIIQIRGIAAIMPMVITSDTMRTEIVTTIPMETISVIMLIGVIILTMLTRGAIATTPIKEITASPITLILSRITATKSLM